MDDGNQTELRELILIGFSQNLQTRIFLSVLFLFIYPLTILGNGFLIFTIIVSPRLHTPMYYFLCVAECLLLAVMAYDRYIAICFPLNYIVIMSWRVCRYITGFIWLGGLVIALLTTLIKPIVICKGNKLNHFACEILVVLELACGGTECLLLAVMAYDRYIAIRFPLNYIVIMSWRIRSTRGRSKAFSTCASHLTVVIIFYGTSMAMYMGQAQFSSSLKYVALSYGVVTPVINPLIYTLRNNDVKESFKKVLTKYSVNP
ncbi:olfactory receptor 2A7-like [Leptodactylus fuscus]